MGSSYVLTVCPIMYRHVLAQHQAEDGEEGSKETDAAVFGVGACGKGKKG